MFCSLWVRRFILAGIFLVLIPLAGLFDLRLDTCLLSASEALPKERYSLPPPALIRALAFGYNELAADILWIRTIIYFTDHLLKDRDLRYLDRHIANIIALDNRFKIIYRYGSAMMMSRGETRTNEDVLSAIDLLKKAHQLFPDDFQFPFSIGAYYMNDLQSPSKKQRDEWKRDAADWVYRASLIGAKEMPWLPSLAARIYTEQGRRDLAIQHLQELYLVTQDERMKQQIIWKLKELKETKRISDLEQARNVFFREYNESPISFVPADLYCFIGQPPLSPFSSKEISLLMPTK
jgi:hypothetical protein